MKKVEHSSCSSCDEKSEPDLVKSRRETEKAEEGSEKKG